MEDFIKEFEKARRNPVYFLEKYYNGVNEPLQLSDDEKQKLFDSYKAIPLFKEPGEMTKHFKKVDKLKEQGLKDWEIE